MTNTAMDASVPEDPPHVTTDYVPRSRWLRMGTLIFLAYLGCYVDRSNISVAAPDMVRDFGMSGVVTGFLLAAFFWGYVVMQIPGGWLANRFGPKWVIVTSLSIVGVTGIASGLATTYDHIVAIRFIMGVAEGVIWPSFATIIMRWFPSTERSRAVNLAQYVLPLSSALMAPIAGALIHLSDWRMMFVVQGIPVLILALAWAWFGSSAPEYDRRVSKDEKDMILANRDVETGDAAPFSSVLRRPLILGLGAAYFLWLTGLYGFGLWLPVLIKQLSAAGIGNVSVLTAIPFAFAALGLYFNTRWSGRAGHARQWHFIVPLLIGGIAILLEPAASGNLLASMAMLVITGICLYSGIGIWWSWTLSLVPRNQIGSSAGLVNFIGNWGGAVGPILVGWAARGGAASSGLYVVGYALLASAALNAALWLASARNRPAMAART
ncbi:MFS transporter [Paraburkholderia sp. BCC1884]|uniref:MFS transporter n=1 Tax=Paraburkholderia sp. BCC1884 TaxID=2562668 RepID=UPI0021B41013|nr:MFS transporter [Paraburkholderia sp. BCC1884]